jgi:hypothetical protein
MIKINPDLLHLIDTKFDTAIDKDIAITYAICVWANTIITLYQLGLFKNETEEYKYRILLVDENPDATGSQRQYKLKVPLFVNNDIDEDLWQEFYKWLVTNPRLVSNKGRFVNNSEGRFAFKELQQIKEFDISRFKACTEAYYMREGQYAKNLTSYLQELAYGEYIGFRETKSNIL